MDLVPRTPMPSHRCPSIVVLGQILIVGMTHEENVLQPVVTPEAIGMPVVALEAAALGATSTPLVHIPTSVPVALLDRTPDCRRDVARGRGAIGLGWTLRASARPGVALGFQPFELLRHGLLDDRGQISIGHPCSHERSQALQLVVELGAGREPDQVASRRQGLDDRTPTGARSRKSADSVRTQFGVARGFVAIPHGLRCGYCTHRARTH
jgi:hypothetical protein